MTTINYENLSLTKPSDAKSVTSDTLATDPCQILPTEIFQKVLGYLNPYALAQARLVSTSWRSNNPIRNSHLWRANFFHHFPIYFSELKQQGKSLPHSMQEFELQERNELSYRPYGNDSLRYTHSRSVKKLFMACKEGDMAEIAKLIHNLKASDLEKRDRTGRTPLHYAFTRGHQSLCDMLYHNLTVDHVNQKQKIKFAIECYQGPEIILSLFETEGLNLDEPVWGDETALTLSIESIQYKTVDALLSAGADVNKPGAFRLPPLAYAIKSNCDEIVQRVLAENPNLDAKCIIFHAADSGNCELVRTLHQRGANLNQLSDYHEPAVYYAVRDGKVAMTECLVSLGANIESINFECYDYRQNYYKMKETGKIILLAWLNNYIQNIAPDICNAALALKKVLTENAPCNTLFSLDVDLYYSNPQLSRIVKGAIHLGLINQGINDIATESERLKKLSPENLHFLATMLKSKRFTVLCSEQFLIDQGLLYAVENKHLGLAECLITLGANLLIKDSEGKDLIQLACEILNLPLLELLVNSNVPLPDEVLCDTVIYYSQTKVKRSLLHFLIMVMGEKRQDCPEIVAFLLKKGMDFNSVDEWGFTPLHYACRWGLINLVNQLLEQGAPLETKSSKGYTPLHTACYNGHINIVKALVAKGADTETTNNDGESLIESACEGRHVKVAEYLITHAKQSEQDSCLY